MQEGFFLLCPLPPPFSSLAGVFGVAIRHLTQTGVTIASLTIVEENAVHVLG